MFVLKTLLRELILPPVFPLLLMLIGTAMAWRGRRVGRVVAAVGFVSLWLFCTPIVSDGLATLAQGYPALNPDRPVNAQAVVVLGGGSSRTFAPEYNGPVAEYLMLDRLDLAAFLSKHYSLPLAVSSAPREAIAMSQTLSRDFGVSPRWIEGQSRDTYENALLSAKILLPAGVKRIVLVTSAPHEWRAAHEFMAAGFDVIPAPIGVVGYREPSIFNYLPTASGLMRSNNAMYELLGEPVRRLLAALRIREKLDQHAQSAASSETALAH